MIPKETTDAYAHAFDPKLVTIEGLSHSLDDATDEQISEYYKVLYDWLKDPI